MVAVTEREKMEKAGTLHWFHWVVVILSLILTFSAWFFAKSQLDEKRVFQFGREADQAIELVLERMQKYEDALWGGVAFIRTSGDEVEYDEWLQYAHSIRIELKYPGINGIGVIHAMQEEDVPSYLAHQRKRRPDYKIHPPHNRSEYYPITYIEPVEGNEKAVGLDMAHEENRFTAANKARDTGEARITGPIVLVQDEGQTPGFLFYAPYFEGGTYKSVEERRRHFLGMVYAPFVVKKLMEGTLEKHKRYVGIRIADGRDVLYNELVASEEDFDPDPQFKKSVDIVLYGRSWKFDIWSAKSFRDAGSSNQPTTILIGGIIIDALLIALFISISRTSRKALTYADAMNSELQLKTVHLEKSNEDLQRFAYAASHDLQEPLRAVQGYAQMLAKRYRGELDGQADQFIAHITDGVERMKTLITGLLDYSQVGSRGAAFEEVDVADLVYTARKNLESPIGEFEVQIAVDALPSIHGDRVQLAQVFQNLIGNAIKFRGDERLRIEIGAARIDDTWRASGRDLPNGWLFSVTDNGIGIETQYHEDVFVIFNRLHSRRHSEGTGLGLAMCQSIVVRHGGQIWVESQPGKGATFFFNIPD